MACACDKIIVLVRLAMKLSHQFFLLIEAIELAALLTRVSPTNIPNFHQALSVANSVLIFFASGNSHYHQRYETFDER